MSTSTVLRIKRKLEDNPHDALLVTCKRTKFNKEEFTPAVFVLRGTVRNQEDTHSINLVPEKNTQVKIRQKINVMIEKVRKERREISLKNRYDVMNFSRNLNSDDDKKEESVFIDVQSSDDTDKDGQSAYDLYTAEGQDFNIKTLEDLVCIETAEEMLFGKPYYMADDTSSSEVDDDDDDSNDENNWRNDYPDDSDSNDSIKEADMVNAMQMCDLDDLSSDTSDDILYNDSFMEDDRYGGPTNNNSKVKLLTNQAMSIDDRNNFVYVIDIMNDQKNKSSEGYKDDDDSEGGLYYSEDEGTEQFRGQYGYSCSDEYNSD